MRDPEAEVLIVGIGASAGGLEAFKNFFAHMPVDSDMAFVLVQHLAPHHTSLLAELLGRCTAMPVREAEDGDQILARHVYVIPPDATLSVAEGFLRVIKPAPPRQQRWPIDTLFASLAEQHGARAVCVVLAGSGSDGARGLRAVKEHGGLTLAQAEFDHMAMTGMPASAAATGLVDQVMPVEEMPARLIAYQQHLRDARNEQREDGTRGDVAENLQTLCNLLRAETGHDFSQYKEKTLIRRIQRRMQVAQTATVPEYVEYLRKNPEEYQLLFHELLIGVTEFFRDPAAFEALRRDALPLLLANKNASDFLRVWVAGCATGEEAYSIAIALREAMPHTHAAPKVIIFATDIDDRAIEIARAGRYRGAPEGISEERRARWFIQEGDDFIVAKTVREMCVFSSHSVVKDPPFSKLDLISCRNLLIYMNTEAQQKLIRVFHYALRPGGFLLLGTSESESRNAKLFTAVDKKQRLYARRNDSSAGPRSVRGVLPDERVSIASARHSPEARFANEDAIDRAARRALEKHSPAYVVIDAHREILRFAGDAGKFLGPSSGAASLNLLALLHRGLRNPVRQVVSQVFASGKAAAVDLVINVRDGHRQPLRVVAEPLPDAGAQLCVVAFVALKGAPTDAGAISGAGSAHVQALEHELESTRELLRDALEQQEAVAEELKSANEEYQSVNEELQSSNEELETSKEEMQSINEELHTVNAELAAKNEALAHLNSDLRNLLVSTRIATIFLDEHLHIRGYTTAMTDLFHLREGDRGRPLTEISPNIEYPDLVNDAKDVLHHLGVIERVLKKGDDDPIYLLRMRPYRTADNVIDGVVLTFVDITESQKLNQEYARLAAIVNASKDAIMGISLPDRITSWNPSAERLFGLHADEVLGQPLTKLLPIEPSLDAQEFFGSPKRENRLSEFQMLWTRPDGVRVPLEMNWAPVYDGEHELIGGEICARDMSERARSERGTALIMRELDHRVKNTLATVQAIAQQTLAHSSDLHDFAQGFMARLMALSKTHNLLAHAAWSGADLREIVLADLAPYQREGNARVEIRGEPVQLLSKTALALGMVLHELATNAVKYGALSTRAGVVALHWEKDIKRGQPWLHLRWTERGGPPVKKPGRTGFGHRLISEGLAFELDGRVDLQFPHTGVVCTIDIPCPSPSDESVQKNKREKQREGAQRTPSQKGRS